MLFFAKKDVIFGVIEYNIEGDNILLTCMKSLLMRPVSCLASKGSFFKEEDTPSFGHQMTSKMVFIHQNITYDCYNHTLYPSKHIFMKIAIK